jgi:hypothetical protein
MKRRKEDVQDTRARNKEAGREKSILREVS